QDLEAAADREDRQPAPARGARQPKLEQVDLGLGGAELRMGVGAVAGGVDIGAAGQADAVEAVDDRFEPARRQRREDYGDPARGARTGVKPTRLRSASAKSIRSSIGRRKVSQRLWPPFGSVALTSSPRRRLTDSSSARLRFA